MVTGPRPFRHATISLSVLGAQEARLSSLFECFGAPQTLKNFACGAKTIDFDVISRSVLVNFLTYWHPKTSSFVLQNVLLL